MAPKPKTAPASKKGKKAMHSSYINKKGNQNFIKQLDEAGNIGRKKK